MSADVRGFIRVTLLPTGSRLLADALEDLVAILDPFGSSAASEETRDELLVRVRQALLDGSISCEVLSNQGQRASVEPSAWADDVAWDEAQSPLPMRIRTRVGSFMHGKLFVDDSAFQSFVQSAYAADFKKGPSQLWNETMCQEEENPFSGLADHISPYLRYIALAARELKPTEEVGIKKIDYMWWLDENWHRSGLPEGDRNETTLEMMAIVLCWPKHRGAQRTPAEQAHRRKVGLDRRPTDWKPPGMKRNRPTVRTRRR
ncbi:hypothetical protein [Methylorubrum extorquens]